MKRVHVASDSAQARLLQQLLEAEGLGVLVKGEYLDTLRGEIPLPEALPEVWVLEDEQEERAREIVSEHLTGPALAETEASWVCPGCSEELEPQFRACWSCGEGRP